MLIQDLKFKSFEFNSRKQIVFGADETNKYFIKIQIIKNSNKANDIRQEYEIIKLLNKQECKTCPKVYELGVIEKSDIYSKVKEKDILDSVSETEFEYILQEYIPDTGTADLADIMLAMLEQKSLGIYQADIKPENIRFDISKNLCYIIDYDQAISLTEEQRNLTNSQFLKFCSLYDRKKHGIGNWLRHYPQYNATHVASMFRGERFNLGNTSIFQTQKTTNSATGIYHTIEGKDIFIEGSRKVDIRGTLLNQLSFEEGEKVLDIGCNTGLLCVYLDDRGCIASGVDNDTRIVIAAKIVANILGKNIEYYHMDLDEENQLREYDTIMLFSVLHHTRNVAENAKKIASSCSRIILEARLVENGKQPYGSQWVNTSGWAFESLDRLVEFCEEIFPGFKLKTNLGLGSKKRYIVEFVKVERGRNVLCG